jgi:hypothetical protein
LTLQVLLLNKLKSQNSSSSNISQPSSKLTMSSNTAKLPAYSEKPSAETSMSAPFLANRIAGTVNTCSIKDFQHDYLSIVQDSPTSYHIALTVDPAPLYRIELASDSSKVGDIQIFSAHDTSLPAVAAARLSNKSQSKKEPTATICTSSPHLSNALWRPVTQAKGMLASDDYHTAIPIVTVPGRAPVPSHFSWRVNTNVLAAPYYQLWWNGPLPMISAKRLSNEPPGPEHLFAAMLRKTSEGGENVLEIRRGGGLDFELSVLLELFVIMLDKKNKFI